MGLRHAGEPVRPEECEENGADVLLQEARGHDLRASPRTIGAAAFSRGRRRATPVAGYDPWAVVLLADRDGRWRNLAFYPADPQFDEDLAEAADPVGITEQLVDAMKTGDCADADQFLLDQIRLGETPREACEALAAGTIFAPAHPVRQGRDRRGDRQRPGLLRSSASTLAPPISESCSSTPPIKPGRPPQDEVFVNEVVPMTDFKIVEPPEDQQEQ